jgi:hypothetical protein
MAGKFFMESADGEGVRGQIAAHYTGAISYAATVLVAWNATALPNMEDAAQVVAALMHRHLLCAVVVAVVIGTLTLAPPIMVWCARIVLSVCEQAFIMPFCCGQCGVTSSCLNP